MRNVIVTGGNRGLGLGIAYKLAGTDYRVIAVARSETDQFKAAVAECRREHVDCLRFVPFDLSKIDQIPELVRTIRKDFGPVYGLVNNAGISFDGALPLMRDSQIEQLIRLNTVSPIVLTKYVVRGMIADGGGRIVNIASIVGFAGYSGLAVYSATKAALIGFTRSLAREVGRMGVNVNSVAPGFVDTELTHGLTQEQRQQIVRRSALKRFTQIEDVANAVEYLLSCRANNITGTVMTIDAGSTA